MKTIVMKMILLGQGGRGRGRGGWGGGGDDRARGGRRTGRGGGAKTVDKYASKQIEGKTTHILFHNNVLW